MQVSEAVITGDKAERLMELLKALKGDNLLANVLK